MIAARRLLCKFSNIANHSPNEILTIYKPDLTGETPPNSFPLMPAVAMAAISSFTQWTSFNTNLTIGLAGFGLFYHTINSASHMMKIRQIDSNSDLSKFYIHFQGGIFTNFCFRNISQDVKFNINTNVLQIDTNRIRTTSNIEGENINTSQVFLNLKLGGDRDFPVGPIDIESNLAIDYRQYLRDFATKQHDRTL